MLIDEIAAVSTLIQKALQPDKLNVAALGNQVPQLHVHVIARFKTDNAWPNPVWGIQGSPYSNVKATAGEMRQRLKFGMDSPLDSPQG